MNWVRKPQVWAGLVISVICLWLAIRSVPFGELVAALDQAALVWLLPALLFQFLSVAARAQRWVEILETPEQLWNSFWAQGIGFLFTNILPLRLGEPARVLVMAERTGRSVVQVGATAVVERLLDVAAMVILLIMILPELNVPTIVLQSGIVLGAVALTGLLVGVPLAVGSRDRVFIWLRGRAAAHPAWRLERLADSWVNLVAGLSPLTRPSSLIRILGWTVLCWALSVAMYWCGILAFERDGTWVEASFMIVTLSFSVSVPSSPGFVGIYQFAGQQALVLPFGQKYTSAVAFAITMTTYVIYLLTTSGLGVLGLWRLGTSFVTLGERAAALMPLKSCSHSQ